MRVVGGGEALLLDPPNDITQGIAFFYYLAIKSDLYVNYASLYRDEFQEDSVSEVNGKSRWHLES